MDSHPPRLEGVGRPAIASQNSLPAGGSGSELAEELSSSTNGTAERNLAVPPLAGLNVPTLSLWGLYSTVGLSLYRMAWLLISWGSQA